MEILGYKKVLEIKDKVIGYGTDVHDMFEIRAVDNEFLISQSVHIAFNAMRKMQLMNFTKQLLIKERNLMEFRGFVLNMKKGIMLHL